MSKKFSLNLNENEVIVNKPNYSANRKNGEIVMNYIVSDGVYAKIYFNNTNMDIPEYTFIDADKNLLEHIIKNYTITYDKKNGEAVSNSDGDMLSLHKIVTNFYNIYNTNITIKHKDGNRLNNSYTNLEIKKVLLKAQYV